MGQVRDLLSTAHHLSKAERIIWPTGWIKRTEKWKECLVRIDRYQGDEWPLWIFIFFLTIYDLWFLKFYKKIYWDKKQKYQIITFHIQSPLALINFKKDFFLNHKSFCAREKTVVIVGTPCIVSSHDVYSDVRREGGGGKES